MLSSTRPLLPPDEAARLLTLHRYDLLRSAQEAVFNEFVTLAAQLLDLPISLLALVAADEVEYKANVGLPGLHHQPRAEALCSQVVARGDILVYRDLTQADDATLPAQAIPAALAKNLRFYAGAPLRMPDGAIIGTLCVIGREPCRLSEQGHQVLACLAHLIERCIVARHTCLVSSWLGADYWRLTQEYIAGSLRRIRALVPTAELERTATAAAKAVEFPLLGAVLKNLHELAWVLDEPLPGFE